MTLEARGGAMQPYQETGLAHIEQRNLALPDVRERQRFFLPRGVLVSQYGVVGFMMLDSRPEERWVTYTDPEWIGVTFTDVPWYAQNDRDRRSHYLSTDSGFKMARYFVMPRPVSTFFERDKFLGEPMIDKMCREGTLPEEFDEEPSRVDWAFSGFGVYEEKGLKQLIDSIVQATIAPSTEEEVRRNEWRTDHRAYVSFHAWENLFDVINAGQAAVAASLDNFDGLLSRFDTRGLLPKRLPPGTGQSDLPVTQ